MTQPAIPKSRSRPAQRLACPPEAEIPCWNRFERRPGHICADEEPGETTQSRSSPRLSVDGICSGTEGNAPGGGRLQRNIVLFVIREKNLFDCAGATHFSDVKLTHGLLSVHHANVRYPTLHFLGKRIQDFKEALTEIAIVCQP